MLKPLENINKNKIPLIFIGIVPILVIFIKILVSSYDRYFLVALISTITWLYLVKPQGFFIITIGLSILFHSQFLQGFLFTLGNANVYAQDVVLVSLSIYIMFHFIFIKKIKYIQIKSIKLFLLFFFWGLGAIARGYPIFGFSAIGESRSYVLILIYYLAVLIMFYKRESVLYYLKAMKYIIIVMIIYHFIKFFYIGGNAGTTGRTAFRFLFATEALLAAFLAIFYFCLF